MKKGDWFQLRKVKNGNPGKRKLAINNSAIQQFNN